MNFFRFFFFADYLLNRLHNIVANFDTFILNIKIVMINYLKSCVGRGTQYIFSKDEKLWYHNMNKKIFIYRKIANETDTIFHVRLSTSGTPV